MMKILPLLAGIFLMSVGYAQTPNGYWQQHVDYNMDIEMNVQNYQYDGVQKLMYTNNSPDVLDKVYYHLYFNAFQPNSEMDIRLQQMKDPDSRMVNELGTEEKPIYQSRISILKPNEIGYLRIKTLTQDGSPVSYDVEGTVLEVTLAKPIASGQSVLLEMKFEGQLPEQVRRAGRNNKDGVALSMTQWYPKMAEYDIEGWHTDPYIAREFHGVWGDYDVNITIDKNYIIGGTGVLQNANKIGFGYQQKGVTVEKLKRKQKTRNWHFVAKKVHDFAWAADPEYQHDKIKLSNGTQVHFLYKGNDTVQQNWRKIQTEIPKVFDYFNKEIGEYPWSEYTFAQGGDGGMEYAMCTLITGGKDYKGLLGTAIHELAHSWFQHALATNEAEHPWMDEGFTTYISAEVKNYLSKKPKINPHKGNYDAYQRLVSSGLNEPATTHSDRYAYNFAYSIGSYIKGALVLNQLKYIMGSEALSKTLHRYFDDFHQKHPTPNDFIRTAEHVSGLHLHWFLNEWIETTHTIDYAVGELDAEGSKTTVALKRIGRMPMPIEVEVTLDDNSKELYYIPLRMMRGVKTEFNLNLIVLKDWAWAYPTYSFQINHPKNQIKSVVIDPNGYMADVDLENNTYARP